MQTEVKAPEIGPNADALTALTRGRGPRRGNLEDLLKYWRPIMKKPGGFRRCVVILMDKPQFGGRPQRICAWLHHELTGKWPNEGNHHGRSRRRRRSIRRTVSGAARRSKSDLISTDTLAVSPLRLAIRESRDFGGVLVQPIAGRQSAVEMKTALFSMYNQSVVVNGNVSEKRVGIFGGSSRLAQGVQAVGTMITPGDLSDIRSPVRSQIFETLTPGGGRGLPNLPRIVRRRRGGGARNKFRCPPGFQNGGTFTNSQFSTCGAQILGIPTKGPGSPSAEAQASLARLVRDATLVREIGDLRSNTNPYDIIRAAQIPVAPKKGSPTRRQTSIDLILSRIEESDFSIRAVRRDGVILEPVVSVQALGQLDEFDDLADGTLVDIYDEGQIAQSLIPAFSTGIRDIYVGIADVGAVKIARVGGEISPQERMLLLRTFPTSVRRAADMPDPTAAIRDFADNSNGRFTVEFGALKNNKFQVDEAAAELVKVQTAGGKTAIVPRWVYETFLSRSAPRRAKDAPVYEMVNEGSKSLNPFFISTKAVTNITHRTASYHKVIEVRAAIFAANQSNAGIYVKRGVSGAAGNAAGNVGGRTRAMFDPNLNRFRCPPGTRYGGRISDRFGTNCGYSLPRRIVNSLVDLGIKIEDAMEKRRQLRLQRGSRRERIGALADSVKQKYNQALDGLANVMDKLADVLDKTEDKRPGRVGPTLGEARNAADLTPEDRNLLGGEPLRDALKNLQDVINGQDFDNPNLAEINKAYKAVEKASALEAGRLTDNPAKTDKDRSIGASILDSLANIMDKLAGWIDPDTPNNRRRDRGAGASTVNTPNAPGSPVRPTKTPKKFDAPRKPVNVDNFAQVTIGGRRKKVDVPELRNLTDDDKSKLDDAVQSEFNDLSGFWANRLGKDINDFSEKDIRKYLKANKNSKDSRLEKRRYNDWLELNELKRKQNDGKFDGDYEDYIGRLAPSRRDSIVNSIKPPDEPPVDATDDAAAAADAALPAEAIPAGDKDFSPAGFTAERGSLTTEDFLRGLSDEDLEEYRKTHVTNIEQSQSENLPPSKTMTDRVAAIEAEQKNRQKNAGVVETPPPADYDYSVDGFAKERTNGGHKSSSDFAETLTDEELDTYIKAFDARANDPFDEDLTADQKAAHEALRNERKKRDIESKSAEAVDAADLAMGDPDADGFHPVDKVQDIVNDPDLNDTTNMPDGVIDGVVHDIGGYGPLSDSHVFRSAVQDFAPYDKVWIDKVDPSTMFGDPDFDIDDPKTRVGILVVDDSTGHVMIRHTTGNFDGYGWTFSKGGIDKDESVLQAATRELFEETGIADSEFDVVGALPGSFGSEGGSKNYFFVAKINKGASKFNLADSDETDDLIFASPQDALSFIDKDTTNAAGKARDTAILNALDSWAKGGGWTGESATAFRDAVFNGQENATPFKKGASGLPTGDANPPLKHTPSFVTDTEMVTKGKNMGLPLKSSAVQVDEIYKSKRIVAAEQVALFGDAALSDPEFELTDFDLTDDMFNAISRGEVERYVEIPTGDEGINGQVGYPTRMFKDSVTGKVYVLKKPARNDHEHLAESSAAIIGQDLGMPVPSVTFAGDMYVVDADAVGPYGQKVTKFGETNNRPMIIEHVGNIVDMHEGYGSGAVNRKQLGAMLAQQYLISEPDNHGANRVNMVDADGVMSVFAFDAGKAFMPHDEAFGEQFFGSKFGQYIKGLPEEDRKAVILEAQKALTRIDIKATQDRINDQVMSGNLSPKETKRLSEISDFIGQRHGAWESAMSKNFADDMLSADDLAASLSTAAPKISTPETTTKGGKMVARDASPTDPSSYASGVGKVAAGMKLEQGTVATIQSGPSQTIVKALNMKRTDGQLTTTQTTLDGPDIVGSQMSVTDGMQINVGTFDSPEYVKAIEFRASLEDHSYDAIVEYLKANPEKIYTIRSDGYGSRGWTKVVQFGDEDTPVSSYRSYLTLGVTPEVQSQASGIYEGMLHGFDASNWVSNEEKISTIIPDIDYERGEMIVADFGDVKVVLLPDAGTQKTVGNMHKQIRIFATGDTREQMKTSPQETLERVMGQVGIDASPPSEAQIRDALARRFLRWNTTPQGKSAPDGGYGVGYESSVIQNTVLKRMSKYGIKPEDIEVRIDAGKPRIVISQQKITEIINQHSGGVGPDDLGDTLPIFGHSFSSDSPIRRFGAGLDEATADNFVSMLFFDGSSSGSLDRGYNLPQGIPKGQSPQADIAMGSGDNLYFTVSQKEVKGYNKINEGDFTIFPDAAMQDLEALWLTEDVYGAEHPKGSKRRVWSSAEGDDPFSYMFDEGGYFGDYTSKGQMEFGNGVIMLQSNDDSVLALQEAARRANASAEQLNTQNLAIRGPWRSDINSSNSRMMVWVDTPDGVAITWGPEVTEKELITARMTGRLPEIKQPGDGWKPGDPIQISATWAPDTNTYTPTAGDGLSNTINLDII